MKYWGYLVSKNRGRRWSPVRDRANYRPCVSAYEAFQRGRPDPVLQYLGYTFTMLLFWLFGAGH